MVKKFEILVDANFFVALNWKYDPHYKKAVAISEELNGQKSVYITNHYVVAETLTVLRIRSKDFNDALSFGRVVFEKNNPWFTVKEVNDNLKAEAWNIYKRENIGKAKFSFTDCILIAQAKLQGISQIITFDKDFKKIPFLKVIS